MKKVYNLLLNFRNPVSVFHHMDRDTRTLIAADIITLLLGVLSGPTMTKALTAGVTESDLATRGFVGIICGFLLNQFWVKNLRDKMLNYYLPFCWTETFLTTGLVAFLIVNGWNPIVYLWGTILYGSFISKVVGKLTLAYSNQLWKGRKREDRTNDITYIKMVIGMLGSGIVMVGIVPTVNQALVLWGVSALLDDTGWMIVYSRNRTFLDKAVMETEK